MNTKRSWLTVQSGVVAVLIAVTLLHASTAMDIHRFWVDAENTTYTHGYLIMGIAAWMLWRRLRQLHDVRVEPVPAALVPLAIAEVAWLAASQAGIEGACMLLLPALAWLALLSCLGVRVARVTWFPLAYLYFALPIWSLINPLPQWATIYATRMVLGSLGIHATFDANFVHLPSGTFEIASGCSGLHFIMVGVAVAALLGELREDSLRVRIKLMGLALLIAVLTNWVRVVVIIIAGYLTNMQHYLVRVSHYGFGWILFAVAMCIFFIAERRIKPGIRAVSEGDKAVRWQVHVRTASGRALTWLAAGILIAGPAAASAVVFSRQQTLIGDLWPDYGPWAVTADSPAADWKPVFRGADAQGNRIYQRGAQSAEMYSAWYVTQAQGRELGGFYNTVLGELSTRAPPTVNTIGRRPFNVLRISAQDGQFETIWYSYSVGNRWFRNPTRAQLWYAFQSLVHLQPPASRVVAVRARCIDSCDEADISIESLLREMN